MLTYNTQLKKLILPEYGRNIQRMVDHCLTIEDRDERTRCAHQIIDTMSTLFPAVHQYDDYEHKLWDHLAIMSDFKLDIDYPCDVIKHEDLETTPDPISNEASTIHRRHYGKYIELMIAKASSLEPGEERDELTFLIANHMKKVMLSVNSDGVEDAKIFKDLRDMSHGVLAFDTETHKLHDFQAVQEPTTGKKKKKKKKAADNF